MWERTPHPIVTPTFLGMWERPRRFPTITAHPLAFVPQARGLRFSAFALILLPYAYR